MRFSSPSLSENFEKMRPLFLTTAILIAAVAAAQDRAVTAPTSAVAPPPQRQPSPGRYRPGSRSQQVRLPLLLEGKSPQLDKAWGPWSRHGQDGRCGRLRFDPITDPAEKKIVDKYGVSRAPMPLVLAVAPCRRNHQGICEDIRRKGTSYRVR